MKHFLYHILSFPAIIGNVQSACNYGTTHFPRAATVPAATFSYDGLTGPLNWYGLDKTANSLCAKGTHQSPIDIIPSTMTADGTSIKIDITNHLTGAVLQNLGTTVEVIANGTLFDGKKVSKLTQFHFHTPSEHRINKEHYPMEVHFVFQAADASLTILVFLVKLGPLTDLLLESIFLEIDQIPSPGDKTHTGPLFFEELEALLAENDIYRYNGSLTTPPCSEGVAWIISAAPLIVAPLTYQRVKSVLKFNSRYTQNALGEINLLDDEAKELAQAEKRDILNFAINLEYAEVFEGDIEVNEKRYVVAGDSHGGNTEENGVVELVTEGPGNVGDCADCEALSVALPPLPSLSHL